jgi:hypothetical protein
MVTIDNNIYHKILRYELVMYLQHECASHHASAVEGICQRLQVGSCSEITV